MNTEVIQKLDTLIRLQAQALLMNVEGQKAKIMFLHKAGLQPKEIADLLGTSANSVSVAISAAKRAAKTT